MDALTHDRRSAPSGDGRTRRRERNRAAVLDAVVALFEEGVMAPTTEQVAVRAAVSTRSIYRYFEDRDDLLRAAVAHAAAGVLPEIVLEPSDAPFAERSARFVDHRIAIYERLAPITRAARRAAFTEPVVADQFDAGRSVLRQQFLDFFAPELEPLDPGERTRVVIGAELPFQFDAFEYLWRSTGGDVVLIRSILIDQLERNLGELAA